MFLIRDVFKCKPGQAKNLIEKFQRSMSLLENEEGFNSFRILVDYVASYWTVVLETEVDDLAQFEQHIREWGESDEAKQIMSGYMDLVDSGYREIFRIV